jgi:hypothetical protein
MKYFALILCICSSLACAEQRIVQTDSVGNKQYHKPQYVVKDNRVYQTDSIGNKQYHKPQFVIVQPKGKVSK